MLLHVAQLLSSAQDGAAASDALAMVMLAVALVLAVADVLVVLARALAADGAGLSCGSADERCKNDVKSDKPNRAGRRHRLLKQLPILKRCFRLNTYFYFLSEIELTGI